MAKARVSNKKRGGKTQPKTKPRKQSRGPRQKSMAMLDGAAMDHIRLMADPCNGKLCPPAYESPGGGALIRYRAIVNFGTGAGETAGVFSWAPGANETIGNGGVASTTSFTPSRNTMFAALSTSANSATGTSYRCVAACVRMITNASETNRSGIVYAGNTDYNQYWWNGTGQTSVESVLPGLPITTRAPSKSLEVVWAPAESDTDFVNDSLGTSLQQGGYGRSAITIAFTGAPAATGYTLEITGVYEVAYGLNQGTLATRSPPASSSSWNNVLRGLSQFINNSPVMIDGVRRLTDYVQQAGASYIGTTASRAAIGLLM